MSDADLAGLRIGLLTVSASRLGAGLFEIVAMQAALIRAAGGEAPVFALRDAFSDADAHRLEPGRVSHASVLGPAMVGFAPGLVGELVAADLDCLHQVGIWMYPSRAAGRWSERTGRSTVISPQGMLSPWITARGRIKKAVARFAYERAAWRRAGALHALSEGEAREIARETGRAAVVIPNSAPPVANPSTDATMPPPTLLYIGRIHPKKNVGALVAAWARAAQTLPPELASARLVVAGWGDAADVAALEQAVAAAGPSVAFVGPVYGEEKARLLASARFVVLPTHSEGLPIAILEAWAAGKPTLMSEGCNLPLGFARGAAIDSGTSVEAIAAAIRTALHLPPDRWRAMAHAARALAQGPFAPAAVARQWIDVYRSLAAQSEREARAGMGQPMHA